ncbi:MAG: tetratricopeptide repeat protein [Anaerolineae bacterium]|nr:tetratricopeptide repeat protein [Anaerolineae bacterium]
MTAAPTHHLAQHRLAQYYLAKLRRAEAAFRRGTGNRNYWFDQIEKDWGQIKYWQQWAAGGKDDDIEKARCCVALSSAGNEILRIRQTPPERLTWLMEALEASLRIQDSEAERMCLFQLGQTQSYLGNLSESEAYGKRLLEKGRAAGDVVAVGHAWYTLGTVALIRGALQDAEDAFRACLAAFEALQDPLEIGRALQGIGRALMFRGDVDSAQPYFTQYLEIVEKYGNEAELTAAYSTMNNVLVNSHQYQDGKYYAERMLQVVQSTGFYRMLPSALLALAVCEMELGDLESACAHFEEGIESGQLTGAKATVAELLLYLGEAQSRLGHHDAAFAHLHKALTIAREGQYLYFICEVLVLLTHEHLAVDAIVDARETLAEAINCAFELESDYFLAITLLPATALWTRTGHGDKAAEWMGLLTIHADSLPARRYEAARRQLEQKLGEQRYQKLVERGKHLELGTVVNYIRGELQQ